MAATDPIHKSVLLDHQMIIDGVVFRERKDLEKVTNDEGVEESHLSHMRSIGDQEYTAKQRMVNGAIDGEETIETTMAPEELDDFKMEWDTKWNPSITESNGFIDSFFKIFNFFPFM